MGIGKNSPDQKSPFKSPRLCRFCPSQDASIAATAAAHDTLQNPRSVCRDPTVNSLGCEEPPPRPCPISVLLAPALCRPLLAARCGPGSLTWAVFIHVSGYTPSAHSMPGVQGRTEDTALPLKGSQDGGAFGEVAGAGLGDKTGAASGLGSALSHWGPLRGHRGLSREPRRQVGWVCRALGTAPGQHHGVLSSAGR